MFAINGIHKYPLWGNAYIFKDGTTPALSIRRQMQRSSWAIPIQTFLQSAPQFQVQKTPALFSVFNFQNCSLKHHDSSQIGLTLNLLTELSGLAGYGLPEHCHSYLPLG